MAELSRRLNVFQSAPPRGGRPYLDRLIRRVFGFQSAPPRGGRPAERAAAAGATDVSIRAPAWRATRQSGVEVAPQIAVSIRAPAWRATRGLDGAVGGPAVSIRAPAWRATWEGWVDWIVSGGFNPRPRVEGDQRFTRQHEHARMFQSAPPRGGRLGRGGSTGL